MNASLPEWKTPDACFSGLWKRIPAYIRLTFAAAVVLGFATHLYMFANKLTNHDDIGHLFLAEYGTASGRWLLPPVLQLDGPFSTPWLIGILSILCIAGAACFTVALLRIRRPLACIVTAGIMAAFPTVTATFTYMFTADAYFLSLMLATLGAYLAVRLHPIPGIILGAAAVTCSMGIYQSYLGVAAVLMVGALLFEVLDGKGSFKELFLKGVRLLGTLILSVIAYMIIVKITTRITGLVDYMGISHMGQISLKELPCQILWSYKTYFTFFFQDEFGYHFDFLKYALTAAALCAAVLLVLLLRERRLDPARTALAVFLAAAYPLAGNMIYIMVPDVNEVHTLMLYGLSYILLLPIALAEYAEFEPKKLPQRTFHAIASWVIVLTMAATAHSYAVTANTVYLKIDVSMRQCTAYSIRLLDKIESCEDYIQGMPVVLLGSSVPDWSLYPTPQMNNVSMIGVFDMAAFRSSYTYGVFLRYYLGFPGGVYLDGTEPAKAMAELDSVQDMPIYPAPGSIQVIDDTVVVKLNG